jgi:curved DNA-binding protein CbpA
MEKFDAKRCYAILDLKPGATQKQINAAYRKLAMQWHPDKYGHDPILQASAEEKLKDLNAANQFLKKYNFSSNVSFPPEQSTRAGKNESESREAQHRREQADRRKQERLKADTERRRQRDELLQKEEQERREAAKRRQAVALQARQLAKERGIQERERQKQLAQQPEKDRLERNERWRKEEVERLRTQQEKERVLNEEKAKTDREREDLAQVTKPISLKPHRFLNGKCVRCDQSKSRLDFYPDLPCI